MIYDAIPCKHCGRLLGHSDRSVSVDIGLDSDECPNNVACMIRTHGADSAIGQAYLALRVLQRRWDERALDAAREALAG